MPQNRGNWLIAMTSCHGGQPEVLLTGLHSELFQVTARGVSDNGLEVFHEMSLIEVACILGEFSEVNLLVGVQALHTFMEAIELNHPLGCDADVRIEHAL